jgi:probable F420-dependent oxidoreductase
MKVDGKLGAGAAAAVIEEARRHEKAGYDGLWSSESAHDPFLPLVLAAEHTGRTELGTAIAVAFARSPMQLAYTAHDLQAYSDGRFLLGLGSQIKPHIERRFSMPWSHPAARMREFVLAMRAIWEAWNTGGKLDFRGEFYTHTLMTPFFSPGPNPYGPPKVMMAAVGDKMTEVAGEVADGMILHPFTTEKYVRDVTLPGLQRGFAAGGQTRADFTLALPLFVVTGTTDDEWAAARKGTREQIAFYGSTPGYHGVLRLHGWEDVGTELNQLSRRGEWVAMGELITDEMLETFAVVAAPDALADAILARYGEILDRLNFDAPYQSDPEVWKSVLHQLKATG